MNEPEPTKKKRYKLVNLQLDRVDLVTAGANPGAHIELFKAEQPKPKAEPITMAQMDELRRQAAELDALVGKERGGGSGRETPTGQANAAMHAAVEEVERIANRLQDESAARVSQPNGPSQDRSGGRNQRMSPTLPAQQALVQALAQVSPATKTLYMEYRRQQDRPGESGGGNQPLDPVVRKQVIDRQPDKIRKLLQRPPAGEAIRAARQAAALTQEGLAFRVGCSRESIVAVEAKGREVSSLLFNAVAKTLGLNPDML